MKKERVHIRISKEILRNIQSGEWREGSRLPSEHTLSTDFGASRNSVRQALQLLSAQGFIRCIHGKGSFVLKSNITCDLDQLISLEKLIRDNNRTPSTKVLQYTADIATKDEQQKLNLDPQEPVYHIKRVKYANGEPLVYNVVTVAGGKLPGLVSADLEGSLTDLLEEGGFRGQYATGTVRVGHANEAIVDAMGLSPGTSLLLFENIVYDGNGNPIMMIWDYCTNAIQFLVRRERE